MTIKGVLLVGAAMCALAAAPAFASSAPHMVAAAAHPGNVHVKTALHRGTVSQITSTISVSTSVSAASAYYVKTPLQSTFYTFYDSGSFCNASQKEAVKIATPKTLFGHIGAGVETLTGYCSTAPTKFYGDVYTLHVKKAKKKPDTFTSTLVGKKIHYNGGLYDINVNLDVSVYIGS